MKTSVKKFAYSAVPDFWDTLKGPVSKQTFASASPVQTLTKGLLEHLLKFAEWSKTKQTFCKPLTCLTNCGRIAFMKTTKGLAVSLEHLPLLKFAEWSKTIWVQTKPFRPVWAPYRRDIHMPYILHINAALLGLSDGAFVQGILCGAITPGTPSGSIAPQTSSYIKRIQENRMLPPSACRDITPRPSYVVKLTIGEAGWQGLIDSYGPRPSKRISTLTTFIDIRPEEMRVEACVYANGLFPRTLWAIDEKGTRHNLSLDNIGTLEEATKSLCICTGFGVLPDIGLLLDAIGCGFVKALQFEI